MRGTAFLTAGLLAGALVLSNATQTSAASCETRALWETDFAYIDKISTTCRILTSGALIAAGLYVPYPSIVAELGGSGAATVAKYAAAFGVDLKRAGFDKHHICRLVRAGNALHNQGHPGVRKRLLQYGLCRPGDDACKAQVRAVIFKLYDLPADCPQV